MLVKKRLENVCSTALSGTLKVVNPIKKTIIKTNCEVHLFIQKNALDILKHSKYIDEYNLFMKYLPQINRGLVWADQDFKSYFHFYSLYDILIERSVFRLPINIAKLLFERK